MSWVVAIVGVPLNPNVPLGSQEINIQPEILRDPLRLSFPVENGALPPAMEAEIASQIWTMRDLLL